MSQARRKPSKHITHRNQLMGLSVRIGVIFHDSSDVYSRLLRFTLGLRTYRAGEVSLFGPKPEVRVQPKGEPQQAVGY